VTLSWQDAYWEWGTFGVIVSGNVWRNCPGEKRSSSVLIPMQDYQSLRLAVIFILVKKFLSTWLTHIHRQLLTGYTVSLAT